MPVIPGYEQRVSARGPLGPDAQNINTGAIISLGKEVQREIERREQINERALEESSLVSATSDLQTARSFWSEQLAARKANAPEGAAGFTTSVLKDFDTDAKERLSKARTDRAREYLAARLADVRLSLQEDAQRFETGASIRAKQSNIEKGTEAARTALDFRPEDYGKIRDEQLLAIAGSGLPDEQREAAAFNTRAGLSTAAVGGMIRRDPYGTLKELNNEKSKVEAISDLSLEQRQRARSVAQSEINRREADARAARAESRDLLQGDIQDAFAARTFGLPAQLPTRPRYIAAYGAEGADRYNADQKRMAVFDVVGEVAFLPPQDAIARLDQLKPKEQAGADEAADNYKAAINLYASQRQQLEKNPVETLTARDPEVNAMYQRATENPDNWPAYFSMLRSKQEALGVADPKLLTEGHRAALAAELQFSAEQPRRRTEVLQQMQMAYGKDFPAVMKEVAPKLDGLARVLISMQPKEAARLDAAYAQSSALKDVVPATSNKAINDTLEAELAQFAGTLGDNVDGPSRLAEHTEAATLYAKLLVSQGADPETAAREAARVVINDQYTYRDTLRIPKVYNDDRIVGALEGIRGQLAESGSFLVETSKFSTPDQAQKDMRNIIGRQGYWITNEDGTGAVLKFPHFDGLGEVYRANGSRVEYTFEELAEMAVSASAMQADSQIIQNLAESVAVVR